MTSYTWRPIRVVEIRHGTLSKHKYLVYKLTFQSFQIFVQNTIITLKTFPILAVFFGRIKIENRVLQKFYWAVLIEQFYSQTLNVKVVKEYHWWIALDFSLTVVHIWKTPASSHRLWPIDNKISQPTPSETDLDMWSKRVHPTLIFINSRGNNVVHTV